MCLLRVPTSLGRKNFIGSLDRVNSDKVIYTRESVQFGPVCLPDTNEMLKKQLFENQNYDRLALNESKNF